MCGTPNVVLIVDVRVVKVSVEVGIVDYFIVSLVDGELAELVACFTDPVQTHPHVKNNEARRKLPGKFVSSLAMSDIRYLFDRT